MQSHGKRNGHRPTPKRSSRHHSQQSASQDSSATESMNEKMAKAKDLESDLEKLQAAQKAKRKIPSDEAKSSAIRLELCSLFSDVIILDPQFAVSHNVIERIWKHCFYGRINELRLRASKEKSRAKKRSSTAGGVGGSSVASNASAENIAEEVEKQLKQFLKEAVALYEYLIKKYVENLSSESQASSTASQDSQNDYHDAIMSSLYRMHIHLGDLHRYSLTFKQAEQCYLTAAKLAPGMGNSYNQLAVVAQSQDSLTAVALYYYARSLMATIPFETSRPNLVRLFESNHKWLSEHSRNIDLHSRSLMSVNSGKKAQKDWLNKEKTAMTRTTLSKMVDLQHAFFRGISIDEGDGKVDLKELMDKMSSQLADFNELLSNSSCSELLLCKIVSILAFSTLGASNAGKLSGTDHLTLNGDIYSNSNLGVIMNNQAIAFSFLLRFLSLLANHIAESITEKESSKGGGNMIGNVRSLSSLLLGLSFAASLYTGSKWFHGLPLFPILSSDYPNQDKTPIRDLCRESHFEFWGSVASIVNRFKALNIHVSENEHLPEYEDIRDFDDFHYYVPFASFLNRAQDRESKYASLGEAMSALTPNTPSASSKGKEEEAIAKIRLFISVASRAIRPASLIRIENGGPYYLEEDPTSNTLRALREDDLTHQNNIEGRLLSEQDNKVFDEEVDASKSKYSHLGIPLLTPAAILGETAPIPSPFHESDSHTKVDNFLPKLTITQPKKSAQKPLPPPPGFSGPPANLDSTSTSFLPQPEPTWAVNSSTFVTNFSQRNSLHNGFQSSPNTGLVSQAGPSIFDTLNPFAITSENSAVDIPSVGLDLNLMLRSNTHTNTQGALQSVDSDQYSHHESLLKFLFESNSSDEQGNDDSQQGLLQLHGVPRTRNPFAN
ncbi:hypothetical protein HJC23_007140 [Cyclotella cryptica]|uniref:Protein SMG7 n=1 Tax=Cyclotella cryptica TaxID=29204 RepID=A0ABD3QPL3_9STRA|eukprot:CCRYP_003396-RA/>CCRYP_003396-RA protein AED:0.00 eAED:0.00 QI:0/-1/0/1/-1/1/1/0/892